MSNPEVGGTRAIVTKNDLRLNHALYCNDEAEMKPGIKVARDEIQMKVDSEYLEYLKQTQPEYAECLEQTKCRKYLEQLNVLLENSPLEAAYICCFCALADEQPEDKQDDRLSQWRAYGANGNGVSIRVEGEVLGAYAGKHDLGFLSIWNVFYDPKRQGEIMERAILETYKIQPKQATRTNCKKAKDIIDFFVPTLGNREGFRTTRVTVDGKRMDVEVAELLNGVERPPKDQANR